MTFLILFDVIIMIENNNHDFVITLVEVHVHFII